MNRGIRTGDLNTFVSRIGEPTQYPDNYAMPEPGTPPITVHDRVPFTASVTPVQAAAWVRAKLVPRGWAEREWRDGPRGGAQLLMSIMFDPPEYDGPDSVDVPAQSSFAYYPRRMVELVDALVALGLASKPSEVLRGMAEIEL